jgi:peptide deformylase
MKILKLRRIGDPILHQPTKKLTKSEILSDKTQQLISDIKYTCDECGYGVGMSASQVGESLALSIISIKPTEFRPNTVPFERVLINAEISKTFGDPTPKWEGCCSVGGPASKDLIYGQVPRYEKVRIKYLNEKGEECNEVVNGFLAHVVQHEIDHTNGIVFTDLANPKTLMMGDEYMKRIVKAKK